MYIFYFYLILFYFILLFYLILFDFFDLIWFTLILERKKKKVGNVFFKGERMRRSERRGSFWKSKEILEKRGLG